MTCPITTSPNYPLSYNYMEYNLTCSDIEIDGDTRAYLERKLTHIEKFIHHDAAYKLDADLKYSSGIDAKEERYHAAFTLKINGTTLNAQANGQSANEAIDIAAAELAREVTSHKSRNESLVRDGALKAKKFLQGLRG